MDFPHGNKYKQNLEETFGQNAKLLEEHLSKINLKLWLKVWAIGLALLSITLFAIFFSVNLALWLL